MAGFNEYPYRDYSGYNLDWLTKKAQQIDQALKAAERAEELAAEARRAALNALGEVEAAFSAAEAAQSTADSAAAAAAAAQTTADSANTASEAAQSTANSAAAAAAAAQTTADNANTAAGAAQTTADSVTTAFNTANTNILSGMQLNDNNVTTFSFSGLHNIGRTSYYKYALLWGGTNVNSYFFAFVFLTTDNVVNIREIFNTTGRTVTGAVNNNVLTFTTSSTMYGGLRLLWLN